MNSTQHSMLTLLAIAVAVPASSQAAESAAQRFATQFPGPGQVIVAPPGKLDARDRAFIEQAAAYHRDQVRAAKRVFARADTQATHDYATRVDHDQSSAYAKLSEVAAMQGITLPELGQASGDSGAGPDSSATDKTSLLRETIDRHRAELARFERERKQSKAPNLNAYIDATTPVIEEHLKLARRLLSAMTSADADQTQVERGRYLARVGDCESCHTRDGGEPYAGGRAIKTPYGGVIYSANITPSPEGIGGFTDKDFLTALHEGLSPDGEPYYPAFPYPSFTKVSDEDALAIKAYLDTVKPSGYVPPKPDLPWPLGLRDVLYAWQELYFKPGRFKPDSSKSDAWNRGAYLVEGLGHCGACHTPRNLASAKIGAEALTGAMRQGWHAPDLRGLGEGISDFSVDDLAEFLQSGHAKPAKIGAGPQTAAMGPMAEVIHDSLSYLSDDDLRAMALYLKDLPPVQEQPPATARQRALDPKMYALGESLYQGWCVACHRDSGQGRPPYVPGLRNNPVVKDAKANNVVMSLLIGSPADVTQAYSPYVRMPSFAETLDDTEIAAVATYLRARWGGDSSAQVPVSLPARLRAQLEQGEYLK
ncbi:Gluconate 2-dehydrogenase (acceptor) [Thiorhodococcus drewsii AZ1]|uniref:Gluconate 2-dehydrogenase (Acceptor) n=1 Tax=Thiorhodococcus drewsii AZ1 TaxID=765913 RepID=G2E2B2_9GAMM|nr:c-type cytochrome [Thiorhodococcus drewsii]EGV30828.1 Gluconate 2-dehydrogenase (acceptor) [Thiorhodococcus drewsii AZ1]